MTEHPFLSVRGIRKSFGDVEVLHGVDLDVAAGSVLALLGENGAGKSTLVRVIAGDLHPDAGEIALDGTPHDVRDVATARRLGIRLIYQEISDAPPLSVAENIVLGAWPTRHGFVRNGETRATARKVLDSLGVNLPLDSPVGSLRLGERQTVEIARALAGQGRCLIFDEPTAALSDAETERLFEVINGLRERGVAILYITHRLDEVFRLADEVCVLRDGHIVLHERVSAVGKDQVVEAMVGRTVEQRGRGREVPAATGDQPAMVALERASSGDAFTDVDLAVRPGEIVTLYGKVGSGASEVAEAIFGMHPVDRGTLTVGGRRTRFRHPADAIAAGVGCLPGDRQREAMFRSRSVAENLAAPSWGGIARARAFVTRGSEAVAYRRWHDALGIRSRDDPEQQIWTLSGGNQQKVVLGRWLERGSRVLVLVEPTRGVDVGARQEIYRAIRSLAERGSAVVVATSDYEDVIELADRAIVMVRGRTVAELTGEAVVVEALTQAAGGVIND
ncbi:sugar ABC transporter ATP-binding protein [Streptosporangium amethystogenes subsp. fukuiense]|uniref:Sugar ABC transporter ATP-binding protein n=2 Tax=Streptosporangium amethystogenes TaxID=2002 RepID=A0ABW2SQR6_9ACTN